MRERYYRVAKYTLAGLGAICLLLAAPGCSFIRPWDLAHRPDPVEEMRRVAYAPVPTKPLALRDAVRLALVYNLDTAVKQLEHDIRSEAATGAKLAMLPKLNLNFRRTRRDNEQASYSMSFQRRTQSLESSVSSERAHKTYGLHLAWNIIDFGLSYLRARQAEEEARIRENRLQRVRQDLALDVTDAYWKAAVARQAAQRTQTLLDKAKTWRAALQRQIRSKKVNELKGLDRENAVAQMQVRLRDQARKYQKAKVELARLIGLPPGADFKLAPVDFDQPVRKPTIKRRELEAMALRNRPEIAELVHKQQIQQDEVEAKIIKMFPGVSLLFDREHDSNKFLKHRTWQTIGVDTALDLLSLPRKWKDKRTAVRRVELVRRRRMAMAVGIVTQVHLALLELDNSLEQCKEARDLDRLRQRLLAATYKYRKREGIDQGKVLERESDALFAHLRYLQAYASCRVAIERLENTLGDNLRKFLASPVKAEKTDKGDKEPKDAHEAGEAPRNTAEHPLAELAFAHPDDAAEAPELDADPETAGHPLPPATALPASHRRIRGSSAGLFPALLRRQDTGKPAIPPRPPARGNAEFAPAAISPAPAAEVIYDEHAASTGGRQTGDEAFAMSR